MHVPVKIALPLNVAVPSFVLENAVGIEASALVKVVASALAEADELVFGDPPTPVVRLKGEHPTKFGAVELTAEHS